MNRAIKYRLYPTSEQKVFFNKTFGCCRKVYNLMLKDKINSYEQTGKFCKVNPASYKSDYPYLKEVDSLALTSEYLHLKSAFKNCFDKKRKVCNGFPKFKSAKHSRKSYTTNCQYPKKSNKLKRPTIRMGSNYIHLPKLGDVEAVVHRCPGDGWLIKSATVSCDPDGKYYASVLFEYETSSSNYVINPVNAIGLDYSSEHLYVDNNGNKGSYHKYYRESYKKLAKAQRQLSRKQGSLKNSVKSKNYLKQLRKVSKIHKHIANQRLDNLHKKSTEIANQYDIVCVETLNLKNMANKGFGNGKATLDNGYGMFLNMLDYKLSDRGKKLSKVDKWYPSSQLCHICGYRNSLVKNLRIRKWKCPECSSTHDRDINAAINILNEGLRVLELVA